MLIYGGHDANGPALLSLLGGVVERQCRPGMGLDPSCLNGEATED
jgi:hypothetical protein